jgi:pimeloyl-ACP methyl ester carboxylesterase
VSVAASSSDEVQFAALQWRGRPVQLEYQWVGNAASPQPVIVFLHEGLGSLAMWKDFPARLCNQLGFKGLVFSRCGYGRSTPKPPHERWPASFMHAQAHDVLPALFDALNIHRPWLLGHSDGGSIALLHAAKFDVTGVVVVAPHIFVEDLSISSIQKAREAYATTDLKHRLARYHADPDSAFRGWNDIWLDPAFRSWNIQGELATITAPVLAVQGADDEYGTLAQIRGIAQALPKTRLLVIPECGHSPHRDQPRLLIQHTAEFVLQSSAPQSRPFPHPL